MRCKSCKEKFKPKYFNQKYCMDNDICIKVFAEDTKAKAWKDKKKVLKADNGWSTTKKPKNVLQDQLNKLARLIDDKFNYNCISCSTTNNVQYAGGHRRSVGSNSTLRYNLHNIHKQCNKGCNKEKSGNPDGYDEGLIKRYDLEYKNFVKYELQKQYKYIDLGGIDYEEKIKVARKIIRDFDTYIFNDAKHARNTINNILNIY